MPALSSTMSEGKIVQWLKEVGDPIRPGEPVMVVESDKADMDVEAFEEGYLAQVLVDSGGTAPVGATVGLVAKRKEDIEAVRRCGLACIVDGSGSRHDGTTAYPDNMPERTMAAAAPEKETAVAASPAPSPPSTTPQSPTPVAPSVAPGTPPAKPPGMMEVFMPALSSTMTEGKIVQWLREVGEHVTKGAPVMIVESDKADMDVESFEEGYLAYVATPSGGMQAVGEAVGYLAATKADIPAVQAWARAVHEGGGATVKAPAAVEQAAPPPPSPPSPPSPPEPRVPETAPAPPPPSSSGRIIASPYAKKLARERGLDLHGVKGSGPNGRIIAEDVEREARRRAVEQAAAPSTRSIATPEAKKLAKARGVALDNVRGTGPYGRITGDDVRRALGEPMEHEAPEKKSETVSEAAPAPAPAKIRAESSAPAGSVPMTGLQKAVMNNMNASLSVPVFRVSYRIVTDALDALHARLKTKGMSVSALLAKAVGLTLKKHPIMNARFEPPASIFYPEHINVAVAVALPDGGLITPVLRDAADTDVYELNRRWKSLVRAALEKKLKPEEYQSGTFAISNMGMFGVSAFDAILPSSTGAIMAVAASLPEVVVQPNGFTGVSRVMQVTVTSDHRHIYGAQVAAFLRDLADLLQNRVEDLLY